MQSTPKRKADVFPSFRKGKPKKNEQFKNLLEVLSARKVPDGVLSIVLTFLAAMTLAPYLGGRALWILGTSPVLIPTLSERMFWIFVIIAPFMWAMLLGRFLFSLKQVGVAFGCATCLSVGVVIVHSSFPTLGLSAVDVNFSEDHEIPAWYLTAGHEGKTYHYFRTEPIELAVEQGCALRIDTVEVSARAVTRVEKQIAGFDIQVFAGTSEMLPHTFISQQSNNFKSVAVSNFKVVRGEPSDAEVKGRATVKVVPKDIADGSLGIEIVYDFVKNSARVKPEAYSNKKIEREDIVVRDRRVKIQLIGWTLYGDTVFLTLQDPIIRVAGTKHCGILG